MSNEIINPYQTFRDDVGQPLANGTITFNVNNTTTIDTIYSDEALSVTQSNPYTLDAYGRIAGDVKYVGKKRLVIKTAAGGTVRTLDNVATSADLSADTLIIFETKTAMIASTSLKVGDHVMTLGYSAIADGGGSVYDIVAAATGTDDGGEYIDLDTHQALNTFPGGIYNVRQWGCVGTGDVGTNLENALAADKKSYYIPAGTYETSGKPEILASTRIYGDGIATIFDSNVTDDTNDNTINGVFSAKDRSDIELADMKFQIKSGTGAAIKIKFIGCDNVKISGLTFEGAISGASVVTGTAINIYGSDDVRIESCNFYDFSTAIYFSKENFITSGADSGACYVNDCTFLNKLVPGTQDTPVFVYPTHVEVLTVDNCYFEGIDTTATGGTQTSYCIYTGDGSPTKLIARNNVCIAPTSPSNDVVGFNLNELADAYLLNNDFVGFTQAIQAVGSVPERILVDGGNIDGGGYGCFLGNSDGSVHEVRNVTFNNLTENAIRFGSGSGDFGLYATAKNNTIQNIDTGGIFFNRTLYGDAIGNTIINCNADANVDSSSTQAHSCIAYNSTNKGIVDGNRFINIVGTDDISLGHALYGVGLFTTNMEVQVTRNNYFEGMEVAAVKNPITATPGTGTWLKGVTFDYWAQGAGGVQGILCTTAGTSGTLSSVTGGITSGTTALVVNDASGLAHGQHITIVGVTGTKIITNINGTAITIDSNADATVSGAAVAFSAPVWKNFGVIAA